MSRDSTFTYIHTHASHHADLFEDFCRPPSSFTSSSQAASGTNVNNSNGNQIQLGVGSGAMTINAHAGTSTGNNNMANNNSSFLDPGMVQIPGHFLPFEEIYLPPHLMPVNPEDEDDVVPDMHAAFGIQRALGQGSAGGTGMGGGFGGGVGGEGATGEASARGLNSREPIWRDLGMERLLETGGISGGGGRRSAGSGVDGSRREGKRTGLLLMR